MGFRKLHHMNTTARIRTVRDIVAITKKIKPCRVTVVLIIPCYKVMFAQRAIEPNKKSALYTDNL